MEFDLKNFTMNNISLHNGSLIRLKLQSELGVGIIYWRAVSRKK